MNTAQPSGPPSAQEPPGPPDAWARIDPAVRAGERLVVRHRLSDGSATDLIGWLEAVDSDRIRLRDHAARVVEIDRAQIVVARRVPPARGGRDPQRTTAAELERIALPGWLAEHEPLGEWTLRAGGGFTGRANSCLAIGDPGMGVGEAAELIRAFAAAHDIAPRAQVVAGSAEEEALRSLGWTQTYVATDVLVTRLAALLTRGPDLAVQHRAVRVSESLEPDWWDAYQQSRPHDADPAVVRQILGGSPPRGFAGVPLDGRLIAIGRGHVSSEWLGLASVWTAADHRRQGWAGSVISALGHWAARLGARSVYLQVATENELAHRAYERSGFTLHHSYLYLRPPSSWLEKAPQHDRGSTSAGQRGAPSL